MALPIKSNRTQEACTPISSNCVIWQGPDIPCINLCEGDTISDVTAKLAEQLCDIVDQLDIAGFDLSCFNPICPTPDNFHELVQFIINKLCELANIPVAGSDTTPCPDQCFVNISSCLQYTDGLGNLITSITLKDYATLLGNKICEILTALTATGIEIDTIETRLTALEASATLIPKAASGESITIPSSCLSTIVNIPIVNFVQLLEQSYCVLLASVGDSTDITTAIAAECTGLSADPQLDPAAAGAAMSTLSGWNITPSNLAESFSNLWKTVCDLRAAVATLQTDLAACCIDKCSDILWDFTASWIAPDNIIFAPTGSVPVSFSYCNPTDAIISVYDAYGNSYTVNTQDIVGALGGTINIDISIAPNLVPSIYYNVVASMCLSNSSYTCGSSKFYSFLNYGFCPSLALSSPGAGQLTVAFTNLVTIDPITYEIRVYDSTTDALTDSYTFSGSGLAGALSNIFTIAAGTYYATITVIQNGHTITCGASSTQVVA